MMNKEIYWVQQFTVKYLSISTLRWFKYRLLLNFYISKSLSFIMTKNILFIILFFEFYFFYQIQECFVRLNLEDSNSLQFGPSRLWIVDGRKVRAWDRFYSNPPLVYQPFVEFRVFLSFGSLDFEQIWKIDWNIYVLCSAPVSHIETLKWLVESLTVKFRVYIPLFKSN